MLEVKKLDYEKFYDEVKILRSQSSEVRYVSIPRKLVQALGLKKGDKVKMMIQKTSQEN